MRPAAALALLAAAVAAALLATHILSVAVLTVVLLVLCLRAPSERRWPYLVGTGISALALFVVTPFVETIGSHPIWTGPIVPVIGQLDVTREELASAALNALRLASVGLAFAAYALLLDHDRLLAAASFARRSVLAVALATRLLPTLERDAGGLVESLRGRGVEVTGARGRAALVSPLLSGSLERALNLAEAMEARGYGRAGRTSVPKPAWRTLDRLALAAAVVLVVVGALWL
ncbi:MAG TPA: energy-coupling factor transporter transmembrane component T [Gaiellaceae bacterium]|nr:energy-coupling factor transporter transmembrane component T [Gaiellaceae bacterium]